MINDMIKFEPTFCFGILNMHSNGLRFGILTETQDLKSETLLLCKTGNSEICHFQMARRKFCIKRNNIKVDSIETGPIVIAHLFP